jgi:hypothetical protein
MEDRFGQHAWLVGEYATIGSTGIIYRVNKVIESKHNQPQTLEVANEIGATREHAASAFTPLTFKEIMYIKILQELRQINKH